MKYIRTKDGRIIPANNATHELTQNICDAGYLKTLDKGSYVTIGKEWTNFYGRWVDIIDEKGSHYSIKADKVKEATRELQQADTIEELCDEILVMPDLHDRPVAMRGDKTDHDYELLHEVYGENVYGAIWVKGEHNEPILKSVAKMNEKGELELL